MFYRLTLIALTLVTLACGDKDTTSDTAASTSGADDITNPDTTTAGTTSTSGTTTAPTTAEPTTDAPTTGEPATSTTAATSTTDPTATTDPGSTGCTGDCGVVVVEGPTSLCDENDPNMTPPGLSALPGGPGKIAVTETGFETSCCLTLDPVVATDGMTLNITYTEVGEPCDCICYYTIDYTLSGLTTGTWTVTSGAQSVDVDVP